MLKKLLLAAGLATLALGVAAQDKELLRIIGEDKQFVVQTKNGPFVITRTMTPCAKPGDRD